MNPKPILELLDICPSCNVEDVDKSYMDTDEQWCAQSSDVECGKLVCRNCGLIVSYTRRL